MSEPTDILALIEERLSATRLGKSMMRETDKDLVALRKAGEALEEMTARGWYIAPRWGDLCPTCVAKRTPPDPATAGSFHARED